MNVLLIQPGKRDKHFVNPFGYVEPLGLEAVAGAINDICDVNLIDMRFSTLTELENLLASEKVDLCGITSSFTMDYNQVVRAARAVKETDKRIFVFVGGHHPSMRPDDFRLPFVDAVVVGEGEQTIRELVTTLQQKGNLEKVDGLALNNNGHQVKTGTRPQIRDLDLLPYPDYRIADRFRRRYRLIREKSVTSLESIRGCQFKCNFCGVWEFYRGKVRMKSAERVVDEVKRVSGDYVFFVDDNFFASVRRANKIADLIKRDGLRKHYLIQTRSDTVALEPALLDKWADIGLHSAFLGFEKSTQAELDSVEKRNTVGNNEKALEGLKARGIVPVVSFIVDPSYGKSEFLQLENYVRHLSLVVPFFTVLTPLPGTALHKERERSLTSRNYDYFDLLHPVLPTQLPTEEFCRRFAGLYKVGYPTVKALVGASVLFVEVLIRRLSLSDWVDIVNDWRKLTDPGTFVNGLLHKGAESGIAP